MSALRALAAIPVPTPPVPTAAASQAQVSQAGASNFAGIFDAAAKPAAAGKGSDALLLPGMAKRNRKSTAGEQEPDGEAAGPGVGDGALAGGGQNSGASTSLDITMLAQIAAALAPASPRPTGNLPASTVPEITAAPTPSSTTATGPITSGDGNMTNATLSGSVAGATPALATALPSAAGTQAPPTATAPVPASQPSSAGKSGTRPALRAGLEGKGPRAPQLAESGQDTPEVAEPAQAASVPAMVARTGADTALLQAGLETTAPTAPDPASAKPQGSTVAATAEPPGQVRRRLPETRPSLPEGTGKDAGTTSPPSDGTTGLAPAASAAGAVETMPVPNSPASPAQQVVTALQEVIREPAADTSQTRAATSATAAAPLQAAVTTAPGVKTLTIQLDPGHLGPVSVTLRMKADAVDIQIEVSNPQALHLLERDRHVLAAAVEAMSGPGTALHLGKADVAADGGGSFSNPSFTPQGGSPRQDGSSDAASMGRGNGNRSAAPQDTNQSDPDDPTSATPAASSRARDGSLYL